MADTTFFELVSPDKLVMSKDVTMVVVPGTEGLFGVLPRHTPMLSALSPGVINVYEGDNIIDRIFVANGFAEVTEERCTVLAEEVMPTDDLDTDKLEQKLKNLREGAQGLSDDARAQLQATIAEQEKILAAMIEARET